MSDYAPSLFAVRQAADRMLSQGKVEVRTVRLSAEPLDRRGTKQPASKTGQAKPIIVRGIEYTSKSDAKRSLNVCQKTIEDWLESGEASYA